MRAQILAIVLALLVILTAGYSYQQYSLLNQIDAKLEKTSLGSVSLSGARLDMTLAITNPSQITLDVNKLTLDFFASGIEVGRVESNQFTLPAGETTRVTFPLDVSFSKIGMSAIDAFRKGELDWKVNGQADATLPLGIRYFHTFKIPQE